MKVVFWGNQDNNAYKLCKMLRTKGLECDLYLMSNETERSFPESVNPELAAGYPDWMRIIDNKPDRKLLFLSKNIIEDINIRYDVLVASGVRGISSAWRFSIPIVCFPLGSDINEYPFPFKYNHYSAKQLAAAVLLRKTFRKAVRVGVDGFYPTIMAMNWLGIDEKCYLTTAPEDIEAHRNSLDRKMLSDLTARYSEYDHVLMWLSRVVYRDETAPEYKGTDQFIEAVARLVKDKVIGQNIKILVANHGEDAMRLQAEIAENGLLDHVEYVPHLPFRELLAYLSLPNGIVFDSIGKRATVFGGLAREALCMGAILVSSFDPGVIRALWGEDCPALQVTDRKDVYQTLKRVFSWTINEREMYKENLRQWVNTQMSWERQLQPLLRTIQEVYHLNSLKKRYAKLA